MCSEDGLILLDAAGNFIWASAAAAELLGYSRNDFNGGSLGPSGPIVDAMGKLAEGTFQHAEGDARLFRKDGKRLAVLWNLWALPNRGGGVEFLLCISKTAQASPEGPITAGYRDIFEFAVEGVFRATVDGRFIEVNPALAMIFGYSDPAEFMTAVGNWYDELYVDQKARMEFLRLMLQKGFVSGFETQMRAGAERIVWIAIFARTVRATTGEPLYFEGSLIDITERKHTENALRWSEERFRRLAETTRVVPFEYDPQAQVFKYVGPQAESLFGAEFRRGLTLTRWSELVNATDLEEATRFARQPATEERGEFQTEFRINPAPGGGEVWVKQIVHRAEEAGKGQRVRGFLFEITEGKLAEVERERSRAQLRELAAQAHLVREEERMSVAREIHDELGQALTLLKLDLSWLTGRLGSAGDEEITKPLLEKIGSMEQLIHWTLQSVRRILSSLRPPLLDEAGLKEAIEFHLQSFSKRVAVRYDCDAQPITALPINTATAVFRIFQEILTNVARHANASRLKVILREVPSHVELTVQDNGCGITQEKLNHSRSFGLLGMQERAWAIGGELEITSSPRSGTTVKLTVPIATPGEASVAPESSARVNGSAASHLASWINRPQSAEAPAAPERR